MELSGTSTSNVSLCLADKIPQFGIAPYTLGLLIILFTPHICGATIVLTACSPDGIILATDGMSLRPKGHPPTITKCKIVQSGDCFFAISGMQDNSSLHYDLVPIAKRACQAKGTIPERATIFQNEARTEIQRAWDVIRKYDPVTTAVIRQAGPNSVAVAFAGGPPFVIAYVQFVEDDHGNMGIVPMHVDESNFASSPKYFQFGNANGQTYYQQHPEIKELGDLGFIREMLSGAIKIEQQKPA